MGKIALAMPLLLFCAVAGAETPATMRVDYFHTGNQQQEIFSLDQVVVEALPWSGNMAQPHDRTRRAVVPCWIGRAHV